jgi:rare lipoprotein A
MEKIVMASATINFVFMIATFYTGTNTPGEGGPLLANGQRYNQKDQMFVAHRTLPFGTLLNVCLRNKCVAVTVKDRGPYQPASHGDPLKRIDLSVEAARKLDMIGDGKSRVKVSTPLPRERPIETAIMFGEEYEH